MNYYYFLHDLPSLSESNEKGLTSTATRSLFIHCVAELAIQTGEFDLLLGRLSPEGGGLRQVGAIDRFLCVAQPIAIITTVAEMLEARGQMTQAVRVYLLAGEAKNLLSAVRLINLLLVGVVAVDDPNGLDTAASADRQTILQLAAEVGVFSYSS